MSSIHAIGSIVAAASAVATLLAFIASARGQDIRDRTPRQRLLLLLLLLASGTLLGITTSPSSRGTQARVGTPSSQDDGAGAQAKGETAPAVDAPSRTSPPAPSSPSHKYANHTIKVDGITILDDKGEMLPSLVAAVRRALPPSESTFSVTGGLRTTSTTNRELGELITTEVTLELTLSDPATAAIMDATVLQARGGGFSAAVS